MPPSNVKVFLRVRPSARVSPSFLPNPDVDGAVVFEREKEVAVGHVNNNSRSSHSFRFDGILPMSISQEQVFDVVAKPVIDDVLAGINGTIFAYGQTGSGKTFTITGGAERFEDRGLIPRTISYLFRAFQKGDAKYRLFVSYLEIYNDAGYDLLAGGDSARRLEDLPKVQFREDEDGNMHLRNLSVNVAQKEDDALNLLFLGDTNRVVAETPMNDASTRSHCMFILWVDSTQHNSDVVRRAKLHLVDLAGSERISKTGVTGTLQKEARYINLSLHHLEQVIVALNERAQGHRTHIPYRNSTMTSVLRDSLGGNCKTVMVGAIAVEESCIDETISTCRFAQRVAAIKNNAQVNEELDPQLLIKRLKKEAAELRDELKLLNEADGEDEQPLTAKDLEECQQLVAAYLEEPDRDLLFVCGSALRFRACFAMLRDVYWRRLREGGQTSLPAALTNLDPAVSGAALGSLEGTVLELRRQVQQRDQELQMLVNSLGKRGKAAAQEGHVFIRAGGVAASGAGSSTVGSGTAEATGSHVQQSNMDSTNHVLESSSLTLAMPPDGEDVGADSGPVDPNALLLDRNKAFEVFRKSVRRSELVGENKQHYAKLLGEARSFGEAANNARAAIVTLQKRVESLRMERVFGAGPHVQGNDQAGGPQKDTPEVMGLLMEVKELKVSYQQNMAKLKQAREEVDAYQKNAEQNKTRLQQDFEGWYLSLQRSTGSSTCSGTSGNTTRMSHPQQPGVAWSAEAVPVASSIACASGTADELRIRSSISSSSSADSRARTTRAHTPSSSPTIGRTPLLSSAPAVAARSAPPSSAPVFAPAPVAGATRAPVSVAVTGDEQTDSDIAAYFAAMADLQR